MRAVLVLVTIAACAPTHARTPDAIANTTPAQHLEPCLEPGKMYQSLRSVAYHVGIDDGLRGVLEPLARVIDFVPLREALDPTMANVIEQRLSAVPVAAAHAIWLVGWYYDHDGTAHEMVGSMAKEHLASDDPPGWEIEVPCFLTVDLPADGGLTSITADFRARYHDGAWQRFRGTGTWDPSTGRAELTTEGHRWRWR